MSYSEIIKESLENNPKVEVTKYSEFNYLNYSSTIEDGVIHRVEYHVAPKDGLYEVDKLNKFMKSLIPEIKDKSFSDFKSYSSGLSCGSIYFREKIGEKKIIFTFNDDEVFNSLEPNELDTSGKAIIDCYQSSGKIRQVIKSQTCTKRTTICVYPNYELSEKYFYKYPLEIPKDIINELAKKNEGSLAITSGQGGDLSIQENGLVSILRNILKR